MNILEFFHDDYGGFSMTRLLTFLIVLGYLLWASWIVVHDKTIPDVPLHLGALITFLYGINKYGTKAEVGQDGFKEEVTQKGGSVEKQ